MVDIVEEAVVSWLLETRARETSSSTEARDVSLADRINDGLYLKLPFKFLQPQLPEMRVTLSKDISRYR